MRDAGGPKPARRVRTYQWRSVRFAGTILLAVVLGSGAPAPRLALAQAARQRRHGDVATAASADPNELNDDEKAAAGCGIAAAGGLAATYLAGPTEVALLWGGGMLVPSGSVMLAMALLGQIGASACAIGMVATPTLLWAYDQSGNMADWLIQVSQRLGQRIWWPFGQGHQPERQLADGHRRTDGRRN